MTRGWPLFVLICALAAMPLVNRTLGQIAVAVLFALWLLTLFSIPKAAKHDGEDAQARIGTGS